jgi:hypothetical protein
MHPEKNTDKSQQATKGDHERQTIMKNDQSNEGMMMRMG